MIGSPRMFCASALISTWLLLLACLPFAWTFHGAFPRKGESSPTTTIIAVDSGDRHTCIVAGAPSPRLWCFGANDEGQLGTNSLSGTNVPLPVTLLGQQIILAVSAGASHTCTLSDEGSLWCFGSNVHGQLGINSATSRSVVPVQPTFEAGNISTLEVSCGVDHTCAITNSSSLYCFGINTYGQVGANSSLFMVKRAPHLVPSIGDVDRVSCGKEHTCALKIDGSLWCFGRNNNGQLGMATPPETHTPTFVTQLANDVVGVSCGHLHTCTPLTDQTVRCFGYNNNGQLGTGDTSNAFLPEQPMGLTDGVLVVSCGEEFTCTLTNVTTMLCYGFNNDGQLGLGTQDAKLLPVPIADYPDVTALSCGRAHTCTIRNIGGETQLWCFGDNDFGQLGIGDLTDRLTPHLVNFSFAEVNDELVLNTTDSLIIDGDLIVTPNATIQITLSEGGGPAIVVTGCASFDGELVVIADQDAFAAGASSLNVTIVEYNQQCNTFDSFDSVDVEYDGPECSTASIEENYGPTSLDVLIEVDQDDCGGGNGGGGGKDDGGDAAMISAVVGSAVICCACIFCALLLLVVFGVIFSSAISSLVVFWKTRHIRAKTRAFNEYTLAEQ